ELDHYRAQANDLQKAQEEQPEEITRIPKELESLGFFGFLERDESSEEITRMHALEEKYKERDESSEEIARMHALEEKYKAEIAQLAKELDHYRARANDLQKAQEEQLSEIARIPKERDESSEEIARMHDLEEKYKELQRWKEKAESEMAKEEEYKAQAEELRAKCDALEAVEPRMEAMRLEIMEMAKLEELREQRRQVEEELRKAEMLWSKLPSQNLSEVGRLGKLGNQLDFQQCSQCFYNLIIFAHTLKRHLQKQKILGLCPGCETSPDRPFWARLGGRWAGMDGSCIAARRSREQDRKDADDIGRFCEPSHGAVKPDPSRSIPDCGDPSRKQQRFSQPRHYRAAHACPRSKACVKPATEPLPIHGKLASLAGSSCSFPGAACTWTLCAAWFPGIGRLTRTRRCVVATRGRWVKGVKQRQLKSAIES
ncbi:unnamed protein product, partial [Durusdinium trenchii]